MRSPPKLATVLQPEVGEVVEVASADVRDTVALTTAFRGIDAVAYCLSSEGDPTGLVIRDGITSCLAAWRPRACTAWWQSAPAAWPSTGTIR